MILSELSQVTTADVYKAGTIAARLQRLADRTEFAYLPEYEGQPVATSLPMTSESVVAAAGALPPFFTGLLPEGRRLTALRRAIKTSADDEFSLLLAVGADTIGDVQVVPHGHNIDDDETGRVGRKEDNDFGELFARSIGADPDTAGLAGVQEKVSGRMIVLPVDISHGHYLLKLNPPEFPNIVRNEHVMLAVARRSGFATTTAEVITDNTGAEGLLVTRFDRSVSKDGTQLRLAQEDGLQVLGRYPADKYNVSTSAVITALASRTGAPPVATYRMFQMVVHAYLTGNGDLHAKNLSILQDPDGEWRVAPVYDAPSTYFYGDFSMALPIAGQRRSEMSRRHLEELGGSIGLRQRAIERVVEEGIEGIATWLPDALRGLPFNDRSLAKYRSFVAHRKRLLSGN